MRKLYLLITCMIYEYVQLRRTRLVITQYGINLLKFRLKGTVKFRQIASIDVRTRLVSNVTDYVAGVINVIDIFLK